MDARAVRIGKKIHLCAIAPTSVMFLDATCDSSDDITSDDASSREDTREEDEVREDELDSCR